MLDSLYNPDSMSKEDIKVMFVARQPLLDELISIIKNQPTGAGIQHVLIISPRGMGKTTMLLRIQFAIEENQALSKQWQSIRFPEENYGITDLADLWLKVLKYIADATGDNDIESKINEIEAKFRNSEDLREAAWTLIKDWSLRKKKRLALLVDNFDMILSQIGDQSEKARLRDILMNDGTVMLVGTAPSYFDEITDYDQPLYNFFRVYNLNELNYLDIEELLRRRAELDKVPNIDELLRTNKTGIKTLESFTGGNPRLVLMLYRIITISDMSEVRDGLERLLDAVTPYYKDKTEKLPPQQRKIIDQIVQYSLEKQEGITPTEIAKRIRMTSNQVSSQLKRLFENGYVKVSNLKGRSSYYMLSEPLYVIWSQMRFGRNAREKRNWLVQILKGLFDIQAIQKEIEKLGEKVKLLKIDGRERKLQGTLEFLVCLIETDESLVKANLPLVMESYLELRDIPSLKKELAQCNLSELSNEMIAKMYGKGLLSSRINRLAKSSSLLNDLAEKIQSSAKSLSAGESTVALRECRSVHKIVNEIKKQDVVKDLDSLYVNTFVAFSFEGDALAQMKYFEKASNAFMAAVREYEKINSKKISKNGRPFLAHAYTQLGVALMQMGDIDASAEELKKAIAIFQLLEKEEAIDNRLSPKDIQITFGLLLLYSLERNENEYSAEVLAGLFSVAKSMEAVGATRDFPSVLRILTDFANYPNLVNVIKKANLSDELFPLLVGIEYLQTNDKTLIERLSPEIRLVVDETINTLELLKARTGKFTQSVKSRKNVKKRPRRELNRAPNPSKLPD